MNIDRLPLLPGAVKIGRSQVGREMIDYRLLIGLSKV